MYGASQAIGRCSLVQHSPHYGWFGTFIDRLQRCGLHREFGYGEDCPDVHCWHCLLSYGFRVTL